MNQKKTIYFSLLILFFLTVFHYFGWTKMPENILRTVASRASGLFYNFGLALNNFSERRASYKNLFEQNQACVGKLKTLTLNQAEVKQIQEENKLLRAQLNFVKNKKNYLAAEVIGRGTDLTSNIVVINRGEADGLKIDEAVVAGEGFLVGKIVRVEKNTAFVRLLSDNQSKVAAMVLNQSKTMGVLGGEHGLGLKLGMIPQNETVAAGDEVVTSGLELNMPRGLLIGRIGSIKKEIYESFQSAIVEPFIDLNKLSVVMALTD